jgi:hypothetical protein
MFTISMRDDLFKELLYRAVEYSNLYTRRVRGMKTYPDGTNKPGTLMNTHMERVLEDLWLTSILTILQMHATNYDPVGLPAYDTAHRIYGWLRQNEWIKAKFP